MRLLSNPLIEFSKIVDEPHGSIFLGNDEGRRSPFHAINLLQNADFAKPFDFHLGASPDALVEWDAVWHGVELRQA